jgi:hypothetical protein
MAAKNARKRRQVARAGGRAVAAKKGVDYMREIGRRGRKSDPALLAELEKARAEVERLKAEREKSGNVAASSGPPDRAA